MSRWRRLFLRFGGSLLKTIYTHDYEGTSQCFGLFFKEIAEEKQRPNVPI